MRVFRPGASLWPLLLGAVLATGVGLLSEHRDLEEDEEFVRRVRRGIDRRNLAA